MKIELSKPIDGIYTNLMTSKVSKCLACKVHFRVVDMYDGMMCYECVKTQDHDCRSNDPDDGCDVCLWLWENKNLAE